MHSAVIAAVACLGEWMSVTRRYIVSKRIKISSNFFIDLLTGLDVD